LATAPDDAPLWKPTPEAVARTQMTALTARLAERSGRDVSDLADYAALHALSTKELALFWTTVWDETGVIAETRGERALIREEAMPGAQFFPDARLNFAENLLRRRDDAEALVACSERGDRVSLTWAELHDRVARCARALRDAGIGVGDRVAGDLPNRSEAVIAMLATASIGAIWSSCSPDFGNEGVVDRFGQIAPRVLFVCAAYPYAGKTHSLLGRLPDLLARIPSIERCVVVPDAAQPPALDGLRDAITWDDFLGEGPGGEIEFERLPFAHPLYVMFSSGTTGQPKCIVHSAGGSLLQHLKEHRFHVDLREGERFFYFTTCGWMMWNWLVSGLASGATLVLFDGSPTHPRADVLFELAERERIAVFGTSAKFIDACAKAGLEPARDFDLSRIRTILSTGSPLAPEGFDYVYAHVAPHAQLASISGGTDILSCFVGGNPNAPVHRGEIQCAGLGMQAEVWDDEGRRVIEEQGELVCTRPFPSMPVGFWNDDDGARYRAAYFERFPGVWCHGDFTLETRRGGFVITGRSDAVLNPGGVRIGTAEIYRQAEAIDEVVEGLAIGQQWDGDVRVVLFVRLREGLTLDDGLEQRIRGAIRQGASPRHVPARIVQVHDIPRTRSGKITELAVRDVVHGRSVKNVEALANPEALDQFRDRPELAV
jgi:acetoacetyl-CoA synthetase